MRAEFDRGRKTSFPRLAILLSGLVIGCSPRGPVTDVPRATPCPLDPSPMRRLTATEYENSVRDLFPGVELPSIALPPDERRHGFDNAIALQTPSELAVSRYHSAARAVARAVARTETRIACEGSWDRECGRRYLARIGRRVLRRPPTVSEFEAYEALFADVTTPETFEAALALALQALLESPSFLYRVEVGSDRLTPYETATRLSYFLWASTPDDTLLDAAASGMLDTPLGLAAEVERMLASPRAQRGILHLFAQWLALERLERSKKLPEERFDEMLRGLYRESAERFVWDLFVNDGTVGDLMTSDVLYVDATLARIFDVTPPSSGWGKARARTRERSGILTHPAILASHAYASYPSPVLRGVFVLDRFLCAAPSPPPPGFVQPTPHHVVSGAPRTNREAYEAATSGRGCEGCHRAINAVGFAFEHYDSMGRHREDDHGLPIDSSGTAFGWTFESAHDLATALASSERVPRCVVQTFVDYATGGGPLAANRCFLSDLERTFASSGYELRHLVRAIATDGRFAWNEERGR